MSALTELPTFLRAVHGDAFAFGGTLPATPDTATGVQLYAAASPEVRFGTAGIWRERPRYQVVARGPREDHATAYARAKAAYTAIAAVAVPAVIVSGGVTWYVVRALQQPFYIGDDEQGRPLYAFNVEIYRDPA